MPKTRTAKPREKAAERTAEPETSQTRYERKVAARRQAVLERRGLR